MADLGTFQQVFRMPAEMLPYIDLVATAQEMDLVVALGERSMTQGQVAERLRLGGAEAEDLLVAAQRRGVVERRTQGGQTTYRASDCYRRLTYLSMQDYEAWHALPVEVRQRLLPWHLEENIRHHDLVRRLDQLRRDPLAVDIHNRDILLHGEALALVEAAELHVVVPCDCRTTVMACSHPRWNTCLRLDERGRRTLEQGEGHIVSKATCRQIVIDAHRAGLVHTGQRPDDGRPPILNGNCCPCCSYPFRAGVALGMAKQWPRSHYLAQRDPERCRHCGRCVARCPFHAFYASAETVMVDGETRRAVRWQAGQCFGCGLCATTCPEGAITMRPLTPGGGSEQIEPAVLPLKKQEGLL